MRKAAQSLACTTQRRVVSVRKGIAELNLEPRRKNNATRHEWISVDSVPVNDEGCLREIYQFERS
jgi:hypothetical protein